MGETKLMRKAFFVPQKNNFTRQKEYKQLRLVYLMLNRHIKRRWKLPCLCFVSSRHDINEGFFE